MAFTTIGVGASANDGTGDPARTAFEAINANFGNAVHVDEKGAANGVASLDAGGLVPVAQLPAGGGTGDVVGPASATADHLVAFDGVTGKLVKGAGSTVATLEAATGAAQTAAGAAQVTADTAEGKADAAQVDATQALADALTADGKAVAAQGDATQALADAVTAQATADAAIPATEKGVALGVATLDANTLVPIAQVPGFVSVNTQTGTTYTLALADAGKLVTLDNALAVTVTVPLNASAAFAAGTVVAVAQLGAGAVTVKGAAGVTVNGEDEGEKAVPARYGILSLAKIGADAWLVV
jgi:hypothetical protein